MFISFAPPKEPSSNNVLKSQLCTFASPAKLNEPKKKKPEMIIEKSPSGDLGVKLIELNI